MELDPVSGQREVMEAAKAESPEALDGAGIALLFDRHFDDIYNYLRRRLDADSAQELAAETFVIAYRRRGSFDGSFGEPLPWLYGIAANLMRGKRRQERRELRALARSGPHPLAAAQADEPERRLDAESDAARLAGSLAALPQKHREVLYLYAWAELGYEEIAAALQVPVGTVRSRLARCREKLQKEIETEEPLPVAPSRQGGANA
jgi:RNA polymerase sigma factor (sigma-70 family)